MQHMWTPPPPRRTRCPDRLTVHHTTTQPGPPLLPDRGEGCSRGAGTTLTHVMREASGRSYNDGERSVLAGLGRSRTCCCFYRSMFTSLTPLRDLGSARSAHLEQRWGRDGQSSDHRPPCGLR